MGAYDDLTFDTSAELCEKMAAVSDTAILAFSTGKDSIAAWLQLKKYFKHVVPYYKYFVPDMHFVEESIKYYEDFFGCHIYRFPHPVLFSYLRNSIFQPPHRINAIQTGGYVGEDDYNDQIISDMIRLRLGLPDTVYTATGVRAADNPTRMLTVKVNGAINHNKKSFLPIYDWKKADLVRSLDEAGVKLPVDYRVFGRTFDGIHYSFQKLLRDCFPEEYERFLKWFPLAEIEIARWDGGKEFEKKREEVSRFEQVENNTAGD